ncbi:50S ribosomal protein L4 [Tindallia californiensis]|uniref:Large ribosomal subunit protein uL4 n=1 Tax=Tindallia californiensis TaxID=159292 RepID=A0A1H3QY55_9FIRM|nr:50S ribosomal protein L4 [Tindallia californiensis]SDZ17898.1 large subunit ribosomal protein L4 [Tindallia californiensis]
MPKVPVYNLSGEKVSELELLESVFGVKVNQHALHAVVKNQLANKRQGTQSAKLRSEVRGGGKKPWRQKGTGRARHGSTNSPIWVGGGITFAPKPRDYRYKLPKKLRRLAMKSALTAKVNEEELIVVDNLTLQEIKTKEMHNILKNLNAGEKALIVLDQKDDIIIRSARNIPGVETTLVNTLNVYDILKYDKFVITKSAVEKVEEVYA